MTQTCSKCSRINPADAAYCFFDGNVLGGARRNGGPVSISSQPFLNPFTFPSGRPCRNFDELAMACQQEWSAARDLLQQGYLETFLGGLGRSDLALAAREAARFPDHDRGLDQFLAKLPSQALDPPRLAVTPQEINLGVCPLGQERSFELHLENQGMRLVYGSVSAEDCKWLTLGDAPGSPQKLFEFGHETVIPVHVAAKQLRASAKPLEGKLVVESNGGTATITVRVEVPIKPYPDGLLAGARTPRQIAEKAKANPKEAAVYFEKGKVADWYQSNGWTYPVQGPSASGIGAVQQFFEALGLTPPPKVEINERSVALSGNAGDQLKHTLEISTPEKRPVYAHGASDVPWLEVGRAKLNGRTAIVPLVIPSVPNRPGETLTGKVTVTSNGNQQFVVPVKLTVGEGLAFGAAEPVATAEAFQFGEVEPVAVQEVAPAPVAEKPKPRPRTQPAGGLGILHLIPAGVLALALLAILAWDFIKPAGSSNSLIQNAVGSVSTYDPNADTPYVDLADPAPRLGIEFNDEMRFGITMLKEPDPRVPGKHKQLTYAEDGHTNNTCIWLEGQDADLFGQRPGKWYPSAKQKDIQAKHRVRHTSTWEYPEKVFVTQRVELVPGQSRFLDTVLVRYTIENRSELPRKVGLRMLLDTFIGANDGVPFRIPGRSELMDTMIEFDKDHIPDYVQAWENNDPKNPGTIAHLGLKGLDLPGLKVEPPSRVRITHLPETEGNTRWDVVLSPLNQPPERKDSCVAIYWDPEDMQSKATRELAFTYGLNPISNTGGADLAITAGGSFRVGGEFTVTATIKNSQKGQHVKLELPAGLQLVGGEADQTITSDRSESLVSWRVRSTQEGQFTVAASSRGATATYPVRISNKSIFE